MTDKSMKTALRGVSMLWISVGVLFAGMGVVVLNRLAGFIIGGLALALAAASFVMALVSSHQNKAELDAMVREAQIRQGRFPDDGQDWR
jgi:hypothetical protein